MPFSFVLSLGLVLLDDDVLGVMALDGVELLDDALELGVDEVSADVEELDDVLGGDVLGDVDAPDEDVLGGIEGVVVLEELLVAGGVGTVVSLRCWQPTSAATTAAAAAVNMNRFIKGSFVQVSWGATASVC